MINLFSKGSREGFACEPFKEPMQLGSLHLNSSSFSLGKKISRSAERASGLCPETP